MDAMWWVNLRNDLRLAGRMIWCVYKRIGDGGKQQHHYRCSECGHERESDYPPEMLHRPCPEQNEAVPIRQPRLITSAGPGTELQRLLKRFGFAAQAGCKCPEHIATMNDWGPDKCKQNIDQILGWLKEEADRRELPFVRAAARLLVRLAIWNARKRVR